MDPTAPRQVAVPRIAFDLVEEVHPGSDNCREVVLTHASGEVDFASGPQLRERLFAHVGHAQLLVLDLSAVTFIDSMAIGVLVAVATRMREIGRGTLSVVCSSENERVLRIFDIAGVASLIPLYRTTQEALDASSAAAAEERQSESLVQTAAARAAAAGAPSVPGGSRHYVPAHTAGRNASRTSPDAAPHRVDKLA